MTFQEVKDWAYGHGYTALFEYANGCGCFVLGDRSISVSGGWIFLNNHCPKTNEILHTRDFALSDAILLDSGIIQGRK